MFREFLNRTQLSLLFKVFLCACISISTAPISYASETMGNVSGRKVSTASDGSIVVERTARDGLIALTGGLTPTPGELVVNCGKNINPNQVAAGDNQTAEEFYQPCKLIVNGAIKLAQATGYSAVTKTTVPLLNPGDVKNVRDFVHEYQTFVMRCHQNQVLAAKVCLSDENQSVQDMITYANMISGVTMATSANASCSKMSKMMTMATAAMTAYQAACSAARSACLPSCSGAVNALNKLKLIGSKAKINQNLVGNAEAQAAFVNIKQELVASLEKDLNTSEALTTAGKDKACGSKYGQLLTSALVGITGLVQAKKQADDCEKKTASDVAAASVDKCKDPKNANTMDCICEANPRTPGCSNGLAKLGEGTDGISVGGRSNISTANEDLGASGSMGSLLGSNNERKPTSAGGPSAPSGGGGGSMGSASTGGGGGAGGGAGEGEKGSEVALPGYDSGFGGGGGGGSWGDFGSFGEGENLEAFLPGGSLDPMADGMAGDDISAEITSEGGKSNWEKIRERYQDAAPNLLGGGS